MNERERAIGGRIEVFRCAGRWSRKEFAPTIGLSPDQLAAIEGGYSPLRWTVAQQICSRYNISQRWLATGESPTRPCVHLSETLIEPIPKDCLLSNAYDDHLKAKFDELHESTDFSGWLAALEQTSGFLIPPELPNHHQQHSEAWQSSILTDVYSSVKHQPVKPMLPKLLLQLRKLTQERGAKTVLADHLGVSLAQLSQWLSGDREPGGETTLQLLAWVRAVEAKENSSGDVAAPPEPKTRRKDRKNEDQPSGRHKT